MANECASSHVGNRLHVISNCDNGCSGQRPDLRRDGGAALAQSSSGGIQNAMPKRRLSRLQSVSQIKSRMLRVTFAPHRHHGDQ